MTEPKSQGEAQPGDALSHDPAELGRRSGTTEAHPARVHDVFLGGEDNHPVDREAAPVPEQPETSYRDTLDAIEKVRYYGISDVTDADINVYAATGGKA